MSALACTVRKSDMQTVHQLALPTPKRREPEEESAYAPLASVWYGEDAELLERLLRFYPRKRLAQILDATINSGRFWRGSKRKIIGMDVEARHRPTVVADNTRMPFGDCGFDVVVYDPPHIPNKGLQQAIRTGSSLVEREPLYFHSHVPAVRARGLPRVKTGGYFTLQTHRLCSPSSLPVGTHRFH